MPHSQDSDANKIISSTVKALKSANHFQMAPDLLNFRALLSNVSLYGKDAAQDFIETHWHLVIEHLMSVAAAKQTRATFLFPEAGFRARMRIQEYVRQALPGFELEASGSQLTIDWTSALPTR